MDTLARGDLSSEVWHRRLGHLQVARIQEMVTKGVVTGIVFPKAGNVSASGAGEPVREPCVLGKSKREQQSTDTVRRDLDVGAMLYCDLHGPIQVESVGHKRYTIIFVDDRSRKRFTYFLKTRAAEEILAAIMSCVVEVEATGGRRDLKLHSDGEGGLQSELVKEYCREKGISQTFSAPYTPAQNGVAERSWGLLFDIARSMEYCPTRDQLADGLTKPLQGDPFMTCRAGIIGEP